MFEITFPEMLIFIVLVWVTVRVVVNVKYKSFSPGREAQLLMVLFCIIVVARIVNFPWHMENGHVGTMKFDSSKILPLWFNPVPIVHLFERYDGWQRNVFGNIAMFIPIGIVWPACFKKLDNAGKTILAGFGFSLFIEIFQLFFYERASDVDDLILNTAGAAIGALIFFGIKALVSVIKGKREKA